MALVQGNGLVLRIRDYAESDLIVSLYTREWGKRTLIAKAARRLDSRLGGVFDLLNRVEVVFYERARLDLVSQGALREGYVRLKGDLVGVTAGLAVARLLDALLPLHHPESRAYSLFERFLSLTDEHPRAAAQLQLSTSLKLLTLLGHRPSLAACQVCGSTAESLTFVCERGGVICRMCGGSGIEISRGVALSLESLLRLPLERAGVVALSDGDLVAARKVTEGYVAHLGRGT